MSLQLLAATAGTRVQDDHSVCACVSDCGSIYHRNTGMCIIYQTAVSFVLLFTLRARSRANREQRQQE